MTKTNLVIGITFAAFLVEALFHYQLGAWQDDGPIQFPQIVLPDTKDFISMNDILFFSEHFDFSFSQVAVSK